MTLIVDLSAPYANAAQSDLKKICSDPAMTIDQTTGKVTYTAPTMSGVGCDLIKDITTQSCIIYVRGTDASLLEQTYVNYRGTIVIPGGYVRPLSSQTANALEAVYDTTDCQGQGGWLMGRPSGPTSFGVVPNAPDSILFHELTHALRDCKRLDLPPEWDEAGGGVARDEAEEAARFAENQYRASRTPPLPPRFVTEALAEVGGCNPPPPCSAAPPTRSRASSGEGCFVATAAYGSPYAPEVEMLRRVRDGVLRRTRSGAAFFHDFYETYNRVSPAIVEMMERDPEVLDMMRWAVVHPIVAHLGMALRFPDAPLDDVPEPWRSFLADVRDSLEAWTDVVPRPRDFERLPLGCAAQELTIVLQYLFRTPESRAAYLTELQEAGALPLEGTPAALRRVAERLRNSGRSPAEVALVVGDAANG
jgi:hypothetical protein